MNKYSIVFEDIKQKIINQAYADGEKLPSESQLMDRYGVSRQTIRQALLQLEEASLIKKVHGSGSFVSLPSSRLQTKQVAVAVYDFQESVFPSILSQVEETLFQNNYVPVLVSTLGKIDKERQILQRFCDSPVDGIILQPEYSSLKWTNIDLMKKLQSLGTKLLFMDSRYPNPELSDIPCVSMDNYNTAYHICGELIQTNHRSIGGIFRFRSAQILDRFNGVRQAIVDKKVPYLENAFLLPEDTSSLRRLLDDAAFFMLKKMDAIICGTGEYAPYLFELFQKHGRGNIRTVVIFDEVPIPKIKGVSFITIKYAGAEIGRLCAEKILNEIQGIPETSVEIPWTIICNSEHCK